jgi:23S rRNA pseudouridine2605 synthase
MAKFIKKEDSRDGGRRGARGNSGSAREESGSKKYKAKRSFTKNKELRENKDSNFRKRPGSDDRRPFKRDGAGPDRGKPRRDSWDKKPGEPGRDHDKPRSFRDKTEREGRKPAGDRPAFKRKFENDRPGFNRDRERKGPGSRDREDRFKESSGGFNRGNTRPDREERPRPEREETRAEKPASGKEDSFERFKRTVRKSHGMPDEAPVEKKQRFTKPRKNEETDGTRRVKFEEFEEGRSFTQREKPEGKTKKPAPVKKQTGEGLIRLNKYLSNAGIASRREADNLIQSGTVKVNGEVITQLGYKINPGDKVTYGDASVKSERKVYLLLNKPKDYITTVDDPRERKTVMELIQGVCRERLYPVGRLDRNTTGVLLFTNDGELTTKLTHPKFGVKKVYHVTLNKGLKPADFSAIVEGVELEDGLAKADDLAFVGEGKKEIGIEIHSGRNRIVRRIFEHLGYEVLKLDRVVFAGLTKKDLPRGKHRFLTPKEVAFLKMIG